MSFFDAQDPFDLTGEENAELFSDNIPRDTSFQDILDAELGGEQEDAARERVLFPVHASVKPSNDATPRNGDGEPQENTTQDAAMVDQSNEQIVISSDDESVVVGARTGRTKGRATQSLEGEPDPKKRKLEAPTDTVKEDHMGGMQGHDLPAPQKPAAPEGPQDTQTFVQVAPALPNALPQPLPPTLAQGLPQALLQPAPQAPSQILTQGLPTALPPALPQALPQAAAPAAVLPAGLLLPAIDQSGSDKTKMVWTYERKYIANLIFDSSLLIPQNKADQEKLFSAVLQQELTQLGFQNSFPWKKIRSQFGMKDRTGRTGDPDWTDPDWERIKDDQGATDKAWRASTTALVLTTAQTLNIDLA